MKITCAHCGCEADKPTGQVNRTREAGQNTYCSTACSDNHRRTGQHAPGWHEARFTEAAGKIAVACAECGRPMWFPPSRATLYQRCGPSCQAAHRKRIKEERRTNCETCGTAFCPRQIQTRNGHGRFCSQACNSVAIIAMNTAEAAIIRLACMAEARAAGYWRIPCGEQHVSWRGGIKAYRAREIKNGHTAARSKVYRQKNPDKFRALGKIRRSLGKLPSGTITRIGTAQRWRCAICRIIVKKGYHVDHIMPIAKGGRHVPANVQLLCRACNLRKSDRDPLEYMRLIGRLL